MRITSFGVVCLFMAELSTAAELQKDNEPAETTARCKPEDLPAKLRQICSEESKNYHRMLWRAYHLTRNSSSGVVWNDMADAFRKATIASIDQQKTQRGERFTIVMQKDAFRTRNGLSHELVASFDTRPEAAKDRPTTMKVEWIEIELRADIDKPWSEFVAGEPFEKGTILSKAFGVTEISNASKEHANLNRIQLSYGPVLNRWSGIQVYRFNARICLNDRTKDPMSGRDFSVAAASGLDPIHYREENKSPEGFRSCDTLGEIGVSGGSGWSSGWGHGHHRLQRVNDAELCASTEIWLEVRSRPDVIALATSATHVRVMKSEFLSDTVQALSQLTKLRTLDIDDDTLTDIDLEAIARCKNITTLELSGTTVTSKGLATLKSLPALERLSIWNSDRITDEGCSALAQVKSLRHLTFGWAKRVTGKGIAHLSVLKDLEELSLWGTPLFDVDLNTISQFAKLKTLKLSHSKLLTSNGFSNLVRLSALTSLTIGYSSCDDECMKHIAGIQTLECLNLHGIPISDAGLIELAGLSKLRRLYVEGCDKVTDPGMAALQSKLSGHYERK